MINYSIPDELILNIDQTPSKYVQTESVTMAKIGSKHVSRKGGNEKHGITATLSETLDGEILHIILHNEEETIHLLDEVVDPYLC